MTGRARRNKKNTQTSHKKPGKRSKQQNTKYDSYRLSNDQLQVLIYVADNLSASDTFSKVDWNVENQNLDWLSAEQCLQKLAAEGLLVAKGKQQWGLNHEKALVRGRTSLHADGFGFVVSEQQSEDLFLAVEQLAGVMPNDIVLVQRHHDKRNNRYYGSLLGIVERASQRLVGRLVFDGRRLILLPDSPLLQDPFLIREQQQSDYPQGGMVVARITEYPDSDKPGEVMIERALDDQHLAGMATEIAVVEHDLPVDFEEAALEQALAFGDSIAKDSIVDRKDLRTLPLVTIDGEDARDFDDAVYAEPTSTGWRLVVAIADVAHYVTPGSALDEQALERGTSVYFPTRVLPMLPEALSNGLCSLKPEVDRLALVCDMQLKSSGEVVDSQFYPAVICSHARLTYHQANRVIEQRTSSDLPVKVLKSLLALEQVWECRERVREQRGALSFERAEAQFIWNEDGTVNTIQSRTRLLTHKLIEEAMIAANVEAARFLLKHKTPGVLRVHPAPAGEKLAELERMLLLHNIKPTWRNKPTPEDFSEILHQVSERPDYELIAELLLRAQSLAVYQPIKQDETGGHFGLALEAYSHFTSPIRRYPDLLVHRAIYKTLNRSKTNVDITEKLTELAQHCSFTERRAERASRDVEFRLKCHYLKSLEGQDLSGWVVGVKPFGLFIELDDLQISGLLHVSNLGQDYYIYDERNMCLNNRRTGQRFKNADRLMVRLLRVNVEQRKIDFALAKSNQRKDK